MGERGKALLAIVMKGKKDAKEEAGEGYADSEVNDGQIAAAEQLAALLGVPEEKVEAFAEALKDFIANCEM